MCVQRSHLLLDPARLLPSPQGFLFRFADDKVGPSSKPRGIVDLSTGAAC